MVVGEYGEGVGGDLLAEGLEVLRGVRPRLRGVNAVGHAVVVEHNLDLGGGEPGFGEAEGDEVGPNGVGGVGPRAGMNPAKGGVDHDDVVRHRKYFGKDGEEVVGIRHAEADDPDFSVGVGLAGGVEGLDEGGLGESGEKVVGRDQVGAGSVEAASGTEEGGISEFGQGGEAPGGVLAETAGVCGGSGCT